MAIKPQKSNRMGLAKIAFLHNLRDYFSTLQELSDDKNINFYDFNEHMETLIQTNAYLSYNRKGIEVNTPKPGKKDDGIHYKMYDTGQTLKGQPIYAMIDRVGLTKWQGVKLDTLSNLLSSIHITASTYQMGCLHFDNKKDAYEFIEKIHTIVMPGENGNFRTRTSALTQT